MDWKFPQTSQNEIVIKSGSDRPNVVTAHTVNDVLVQVLVQELSKYSKKLQMLKMMAEDEETREDVDIREFRGAIVDALPLRLPNKSSCLLRHRKLKIPGSIPSAWHGCSN
ncbi:MAG: hypothetical protein R2806_10370 [Saprospiraceae bacterium]